MTRSHRSLTWSLVLVLLCASLALAQKPQLAHAATQTIIVTTARDWFNDADRPDYKCDLSTTDGCSLREAITLANQAAADTSTTIVFNIPQDTFGYFLDPASNIETWTISLEAPLPPIDHDNTVIDGFSQEEFISGVQNTFGPTIIVDGLDLSLGTAFSPPQETGGITVRSTNSTVKGLGIINFRTNAGLVGIGIEIRSRSGNAATGNKIQGNYIGIDKVGASAAPNNRGIWVRTDNNQIGGSNSQFSDEPNIISGNHDDGILVEGSGNKIQGNYIGIDRTGQVDIGNNQAGIAIRIADDNLIGSPSNATNTVFGNIISGNDQHGVYIYNGSNNTVNGNLIGVNTNGSKGVPNSRDGIRIESAGVAAASNKIGEKNYFTRNIISGNGQAGIRITGLSAADNVVLNNFIGPSSGGVGLSSVSNQTGVIIETGADRNTIGGPLLGDFTVLAPDNESNLISGNLTDGVVISGTVSANNKVIGNTIGLTYSRGTPFGNGRYGVAVMNGPRNVTIGGSGSSGNVISANGSAGIFVIGKPTTPITDVLILGNTIGLRRNTTAPFTASSPINMAAGNNGDGITIANADKARIGGTAAEGNIIAANKGNGIQSSGTNFTTVQNNLIGTVKQNTTNLDRGNTGNGIRATGTVTVSDNLVLYNDQNGVWATDGQKSQLTTNTINFNSQNGVLVDGGAADVAITGSTIYSNTLNGVLVQGGASNPQRVKILDNSMQGNAKGIELAPDTVPAGSASNPNHDIDPPFNIHIDQNGNLSGKVRLTPSNPAVGACVQPCTIQLFTTNPNTLDGQGRDKLNFAPTVTPDPSNSSVGTFTAAIGGIPAQLAITATDKDGNTSEFATFDRSFGLVIEPPRASTALPSQVITYTHRITNTGSVDFKNIQMGVTFTTLYQGVTSSQPWPYKLLPANTPPISLAAGESKPVTLTLTLPSGSDPSVRAGLVQQTRITASASTGASTFNPAVVTTAAVTDTTTVGASFLLDATPLTRSGFGAPDSANSVVHYVHTLTNKGNVTGTVLVSAVTDRGWETTVSTDTVQLAAGEVKNITISVAIPSGTDEGTIAETIVTLNVPGTPSQNKTLTDTTTVELTPSALLIHAGEADGEGGAGETVHFLYVVENRSNGTATFSLSGLPSFGDTLVSFTRLDGQAFGPGNSFTLSNTPGSNQLNFSVDIKLDPRLLIGDIETVTVLLLDEQGRTRAAAQDRITIKRNAFAPRLYLPLIGN